GLALEQERTAHREREEDRRREPSVGEVRLLRERELDLVHGIRAHVRHRRERRCSGGPLRGRILDIATCGWGGPRRWPMYPASFEYFAPTTLEEAGEILARFGDEAKVLAGGQSLIPLMKLRFASPKALVDVNGIAGLDGLAEEGGALRIGALVRHSACEGSELLRGRYGALGDAASQISDPIVRNRGTVGGSLAHADPQGDWGSVMLAVGAEVVTQGPGGSRTIPVREFFDGPFTT